MYDYDELAEKLSSVISSPAGWLTPDETREVREFIEVGEYGLAYETLCSIIEEENKTIAPDIYDQLVALGRRMEFEEEVWTKLLPRVATR